MPSARRATPTATNTPTRTSTATTLSSLSGATFVYDGRINRTNSNGRIFTEGYGTNRDLLIAAANQYIGPLTFQAADAAMLVFSTADRLSNGALVQWMNSMPPQP